MLYGAPCRHHKRSNMHSRCVRANGEFLLRLQRSLHTIGIAILNWQTISVIFLRMRREQRAQIWRPVDAILQERSQT